MAVPSLLPPLVVVATLGALPAPAAAWTLALDVPAGCDDAEAFRGRAEAQRTRDGETPEVAVTVRAWSDEGGGWHVRVQVGEAARELSGASCREVAEAAALVVAFSLDGEAARPRPAPARPAGLPPAPESEPAVVRAPAAPVQLGLGVVAGVDSGTLPAASPGVRAELRLGWGRASLALGLGAWARVEARDAAGEGLTARAWQAHVAGRVRVWRRLEVGGALEIGQVDAAGLGVDTVIERTVAWQGAGGSLAWRGPIGHGLEFIIEFDGLWPFNRPSFVVDGEPRFTPGPCLRGYAGLGWRFL